MKKSSANDHILPRPLEQLQEYARADARRSLAESAVAIFGMSDAAAGAIANAVVDPSVVRRVINDPQNRHLEEIAVPGGVLLGIRTTVWSRRIMPDPRNPRIGPSRRHPFAVDPGSGGEDSRFRPVPEPRSPEGKPHTVPELVVDLDSRQHLEWASAQAATYVLDDNDWRNSIRSQGVMEAVWVVPTTYLHLDGSASATVLTTAEGSSRATAVHNILGLRSSDVPYETPDQQKLRVTYRRLDEARERGDMTRQQVEAFRCERMPALILVGFRPNSMGSAGFPTAVKSLVALRHVDHPKPWDEGSKRESLADEVLDELFRQNLITATERAYYAGACTKAQARGAHFPDCPSSRAARIVALFANADQLTDEAIRLAVTSQSTRERITKKLRNELATALIMRSVANESAKLDQVRRYLRDAFDQSIYDETWASTGRDTDTLEKEALGEVQRAISNGTTTEPGPATLELAVRAAYALVITSSLHSDRGTRDNNQPDRRLAGEVLKAMRCTVQGVHQLAQALRDFAGGQHIRAVEDDGTIKKRADGTGDLIVHDTYLRHEFPPPGKARASSGGSMPTEQLKERVFHLSEAMDKLEEAYKAVAAVVGNDGNPLVEVEGVNAELCKDRRDLLGRIGDELNYWSRIWRRRHGSPTVLVVSENTDEEENGTSSYEDEVEDAENEVTA
jgi:hypothetical protein